MTMTIKRVVIVNPALTATCAISIAPNPAVTWLWNVAHHEEKEKCSYQSPARKIRYTFCPYVRRIYERINAIN